MTLAEKLAKVKESELFKLVFEGEVLGLRVKFFDVNADTFLYYDFELDVVRSNKEIVQFVKSISNMRSIKLFRDGKGLLVSKEEIANKLLIQEFENEDDAVRVLEPLRRIYSVKEA